MGPFSGFGYPQALARRLVLESQEAGQAGTPTLIRSAREKPSRTQLERVLPGRSYTPGAVADRCSQKFRWGAGKIIFPTFSVSSYATSRASKPASVALIRAFLPRSLVCR
jgi:hypothetical protein